MFKRIIFALRSAGYGRRAWEFGGVIQTRDYPDLSSEQWDRKKAGWEADYFGEES
jgi:hypothetical protein